MSELYFWIRWNTFCMFCVNHIILDRSHSLETICLASIIQLVIPCEASNKFHLDVCLFDHCMCVLMFWIPLFSVAIFFSSEAWTRCGLHLQALCIIGLSELNESNFLKCSKSCIYMCKFSYEKATFTAIVFWRGFNSDQLKTNSFGCLNGRFQMIVLLISCFLFFYQASEHSHTFFQMFLGAYDKKLQQQTSLYDGS